MATVGYVKNQLSVGGEPIGAIQASSSNRKSSPAANGSDAIAENTRGIEELEVTKGPVSRYECKGTEFNVASRNGELTAERR